MPKNDYRAKDGKPIPGVTTLVKLADDPGGLIYAAAQIGPKYREIWDRETDIGSETHAMIVQHLTKQPVTNSLADEELRRGAWLAFRAAERWLTESGLEAVEWEVSLISEAHRFGGQIDLIGRLAGDLVIVDWKTSKGFYPNMLTQVAGYKGLWNENYPARPVSDGIVVRLGKANGAHYLRHYSPEKLDEAWAHFLLLRQVYESRQRINELYKEPGHA